MGYFTNARMLGPVHRLPIPWKVAAAGLRRDRGEYPRQEAAEFTGRAWRMKPQLSIRGFLLLALYIASIVAISKIALWASRAFRL